MEGDVLIDGEVEAALQRHNGRNPPVRPNQRETAGEQVPAGKVHDCVDLTSDSATHVLDEVVTGVVNADRCAQAAQQFVSRLTRSSDDASTLSRRDLDHLCHIPRSEAQPNRRQPTRRKVVGHRRTAAHASGKPSAIREAIGGEAIIRRDDSDARSAPMVPIVFPLVAAWQEARPEAAREKGCW
jgi:hypothetical protein